MESGFLTGNPLEPRRKCSDYKELFQLRDDIRPVFSLLDGEAPPPNRPVNVACILSLCPGLDKSEMVNAHLTEAEPEFPVFRLLHTLYNADEIGSDGVHFNHQIACIGLAPAARLANQAAPFTGKIAVSEAIQPCPVFDTLAHVVLIDT